MKLRLFLLISQLLLVFQLLALKSGVSATGDTLVRPVLTNYVMDFENLPDFSLAFNEWTVNDVVCR